MGALRAAVFLFSAVLGDGHKLAAAPTLQNEAGLGKVKQAGFSEAYSEVQLTANVAEEGRDPVTSFRDLLGRLRSEVSKMVAPTKRQVMQETSTTQPPAPTKLLAAPQIASIPKKLLFNHKVNLLKKTATELAGDEQASLLRENVLHIMSVFPEVSQEDVHFWDDNDCQNGIEDMGLKESEALSYDFAAEQVGMVKSDLCRLVMMYRFGGFYFDTDILVTPVLKEQLLPETSFATVITSSGAFFQAFMAATAKHPLMERAIKEFQLWYDVYHAPGTNQELLRQQTAGGNIGTALLRKAFDKWAGVPVAPRVDAQGQVAQFFEELGMNQIQRFRGALPGHSGYLCDYAVVYKPSRIVVMFSRIYDSHFHWMCREEVQLMRS